MYADKSQGFIKIQSTELFYLENELANIGSRAFAYFIDTVIKGLSIISIITVLSRYKIFSLKPVVVITATLVSTIFLGYHFLFEFLMSGKTPGKMVVGIRVLKNNGSRISMLDSFVRNVLRIIDMFPYGYLLAMIIMFFERYNRRIGDMVGNTIVIYDRTSKMNIRDFVKSRLQETRPSKSITLSGIDSLSPREKSIVKTLYMRRNTLEKGEKKKILNKFYEKFSKKITINGTEDPETVLTELYKRI
jgi:uncharacterized RDD family membrane protein YckC